MDVGERNQKFDRSPKVSYIDYFGPPIKIKKGRSTTLKKYWQKKKAQGNSGKVQCESGIANSSDVRKDGNSELSKQPLTNTFDNNGNKRKKTQEKNGFESQEKKNNHEEILQSQQESDGHIIDIIKEEVEDTGYVQRKSQEYIPIPMDPMVLANNFPEPSTSFYDTSMMSAMTMHNFYATQFSSQMLTENNVTIINAVIEKLTKSGSNLNNKVDEFDIFGKLVAEQLRQMKMNDAMSCQENIQSLIKEKQLEIYSRQPQPKPTSETPFNEESTLETSDIIDRRQRSICAFKNCTHTRDNFPSGTFHYFPRNEIQCRDWIHMCHREDLAVNARKVSSNCVVCSDHFENKDFLYKIEGFPRRLRRSAVPKDLTGLLIDSGIVECVNAQLLSSDDLPEPLPKIHKSSELSTLNDCENYNFSAETSVQNVTTSECPNVTQNDTQSMDVVNKVDNCTQNKETDDQFDIFGKLVAEQLRQIPLVDAIFCQEKIRSLIKENLLEPKSDQPQYDPSDTPLSPCSSTPMILDVRSLKVDDEFPTSPKDNLHQFNEESEK